MKQADATVVNEQDPSTASSSVPVLLAPRDPIVFRDGRPFEQDPGARAFSVPFPLPRTVTGAVRSHVIGRGTRRRGNANVWDDKSTSDRARALTVEGPLLVARQAGSRRWVPHVPAPADVVAYRKRPGDAVLEFMILRPIEEQSLPDGAGTDLPGSGSPPAGMRAAAMQFVRLRPMAIDEDFKPDRDVPAFWTLQAAEKWLLADEGSLKQAKDFLPVTQVSPATPGDFPEPDTTGESEPGPHPAGTSNREAKIERLAGIAALPKETRTHVRMDDITGTATDGLLFGTDGLAFLDEPRGGNLSAPALAILCNLPDTSPESLPRSGPSMLTLGGERRTARIEIGSENACWPELSTDILDSIDWTNATRLRLQFVTPALFVHGWLPAWMADGVPPGLSGHKLQLHLVGCAMDRQVAISGWRMTAIRNGRFAPGVGEPGHQAEGVQPGPRKLEYAVPAGSVYFFELGNGQHLTRDIWKALWLKSVSDQPRDRAEGFGLVLPGLW